MTSRENESLLHNRRHTSTPRGTNQRQTSSDTTSYIVDFLKEYLPGYGRSGRSGVPEICNASPECRWEISIILVLTLLVPIGVFVWQVVQYGKYQEHTVRDNITNVSFAIGTLLMTIILVRDGYKNVSGIANFDTSQFNPDRRQTGSNNDDTSINAEPQPQVPNPEEGQRNATFEGDSSPMTGTFNGLRAYCSKCWKDLGKTLLLLFLAVVVIGTAAIDNELVQRETYNISFQLVLAYPMFVNLYLLNILVRHISSCALVLRSINDDIRCKIQNSDAGLDWHEVHKKYLIAKYLVAMFNGNKFSFALSLGLAVLMLKLLDIVRVFIFACYWGKWIFVALFLAVGISLLTCINVILHNIAKVPRESVEIRSLLTDYTARVLLYQHQDNVNIYKFLENAQICAPIAVEFFNSTPITPQFIVVFNSCFIMYGKFLQYILPHEI